MIILKFRIFGVGDDCDDAIVATVQSQSFKNLLGAKLLLLALEQEQVTVKWARCLEEC